MATTRYAGDDDGDDVPMPGWPGGGWWATNKRAQLGYSDWDEIVWGWDLCR